MRSVIIITEKPLDLGTLLDAYRASGHVDLQSAHRLVVEGNWGWFAFNRDDTLKEEFDESELAQLKKFMQSFAFAQLEFSESRAADIAALGFPIEGNVLIDNDHGLVAHIAEIRRRIQEGKNWISASF